MRLLKDHMVEGDALGHQITVSVDDEPGSGGANYEYSIEGPNMLPTRIRFQNGPIKEAGVNGVTQEALLAIVIDRLRGFQSGPFACEANAAALIHCENALHQIQARTRERIARGVEGTHAV